MLSAFSKRCGAHAAGTSCLTYYEAEEALYGLLSRSAKGVSNADKLLIPVARSLTTQVHVLVEQFQITALDLTAATVRTHLQQLELQTRGIRAADALHAATAIAFDADLLVSTDQALLDLDRILVNARGNLIACRDTDDAIALL